MATGRAEEQKVVAGFSCSEVGGQSGPNAVLDLGFDAALVSGATNGSSVVSAAHIETSDATANISTSYSMSVGDTFSGSLSSAGDRDWIAITLEAGKSYTIDLTGTGPSALADAYLRLYNSSGSQIAYNDDGGPGYNSSLSFTASSTGTYYLAAGSYADAYAGTYTLDVDEFTPTVFTTDEIADQLTDGYWQANGASQRSFNVSVGGVISVNINALTSAGQTLAQNALELWSDATGLAFSYTSGSAQMTFDDSASGAYNRSYTSGSNITRSEINVSTSWLASYGTSINSYSFQTYIHEIGHALGLGHAGNYNGSASFGSSNHYLNDSWQATVMSYFSQTENTFINASRAYALSPQVADVVAIRDLYGTTGTTRTGNTTYGDNANSGDLMAQISSLDARISFSIVDDGGIDTLDFSSESANQLIDLNEEGISNVRGHTGNLQIARGTVIENAIGGSGNDTLIGNAASNHFWGGSGTDTVHFNVEHMDAFNFKLSDQKAIVSIKGVSNILQDVEFIRFTDENFAFAELEEFSSFEYIASYSDLINAFGADEIAGATHFINHGMNAGRTTLFNGLEYVASYRDLIDAFSANESAGAVHFIKYGMNAGRTVSFNALEYIASYSDLINGFGADADAGATHFINHGINTGRTTSFNGLEYIASYADLMSEFGADEHAGAQHFIEHGFDGGRKISFNTLEYIASYSDLINAFGTDVDAGAKHYINHGINAGRSTSFNGFEYIASYADLIDAFGADHDTGTKHFIKHGMNAGRTTTFNGLEYIASYGDLMNAYGTDKDAGARHFIDHGFRAGREVLFDAEEYLEMSGNEDLLDFFGNNHIAATMYYIDDTIGDATITDYLQYFDDVL